MIFSIAAKYLDIRKNNAFVPGTQSKHDLYHGRDVSSHHEDFPISADEGPDSYCHGHLSVRTPDTVKYDENLSGGSCQAAASAEQSAEDYCVECIEATPPHLDSSSNEAMVKIPFIDYIYICIL